MTKAILPKSIIQRDNISNSGEHNDINSPINSSLNNNKRVNSNEYPRRLASI